VINHFLLTRNVGKYATMVLLKLQPNGELEYLNCGHILPLSIFGTEVRRLEQSNLIVGLISGAEYTSSTYAMRSGERILLATDGVTEAENSGGLAFGEPGLISVSHHQRIGEILDEVAKFQTPNPAQDDCTLLELKFIQGP
jgi:serine phosphatase RsbU (regulator of sigma subunit)